jgi:membrane-associated protease RseP (regulator of RpoE activity)
VATWFLVVLLITNFALVISPLYNSQSSGVLITGLVDGGAAQKNNITNWSVLVAVNGTTVTDVNSLRNVLSPLTPGHHLVLTIDNVATNTQATYSIVTQPASDNVNRATIGIFTFPYYKPVASFLPISLPYHFFNTLQWMSLILLGVALVNMLPMFPFDGDRYFDTILNILGMKNTKNVRTAASIVSLSLLGSNLILSFIIYGTIFPK